MRSTETLAGICVNETLNIFLENCSDITLQQLKESTYENRILFFEEFIYYPIAILLADRYTVIHDYPSIISELYPFTLKDLCNISNDKHFNLPLDTIEILRTNNRSQLLDILRLVTNDGNGKGLKCFVMSSILFLAFIRICIKDKIYLSIIGKVIEQIRKRIMVNNLSDLSIFRSKMLNCLLECEQLLSNLNTDYTS